MYLAPFLDGIFMYPLMTLMTQGRLSPGEK